MKHIFVSHAGADSSLAERLAGDLKNAGHDTRVDVHELRLGANSIQFMNKGIADAHTIVILHSRHTPDAVWQNLEIDAAFWNWKAQNGAKCIVIKLDDTPIPPLLGPYVFGELNAADPVSYRSILERICKDVLPQQTASSVVSEAFRPESRNPFRRVRAEYFEDSPDLLAKTFAPPDALKMGALEDLKPCFLEGSRGTGKSMLLLSLRARNYKSKHRRAPARCNAFGFYIKLTRGAICNAGIISDVNSDPSASGTDTVQIDKANQSSLASAIYAALFGRNDQASRSIEELLETLADTHRDVADFIRRRFIYGESPVVPIATFDLDALKRVIKIVKRNISGLSSSMFVALLDEYENLFPYQQRIVNGIVKLGAPDFSVKIAKKLGSADISGTSTGQELQETHDYTRLTLVYDVEDRAQLTAYHNLLKHIITNIFQSEGLKSVAVAELLPDAAEPECPEDRIRQEVCALCKMTLDKFDLLAEDVRREKLTYYREAAIYRILYGAKGRRKEKRFCGFSDVAFISSGVVRYFQEILGVAYHLTYSASEPQPQVISLPPEKQTQAVHFVSEHNLTTLSRNVERVGEALKYFLLDLGDILRYKLLKNSSEPEAARIAIEDPEMLDQDDMKSLKRLLDVGVREGVFQTKEGRPAFKPKHSSDPQSSEFNVCRVYAPVLQISPRLRWRTRLNCKLLLGLTIPGSRRGALRQLKAKLASEPTSQGAQQQPLFKES
jgi:hypothetical protein